MIGTIINSHTIAVFKYKKSISYSCPNLFPISPLTPDPSHCTSPLVFSIIFQWSIPWILLLFLCQLRIFFLSSAYSNHPSKSISDSTLWITAQPFLIQNSVLQPDLFFLSAHQVFSSWLYPVCWSSVLSRGLGLSLQVDVNRDVERHWYKSYFKPLTSFVLTCQVTYSSVKWVLFLMTVTGLLGRFQVMQGISGKQAAQYLINS